MSADVTRERIVQAADDLFYRQGFEHTSFADIADAVGISRGNFYYHFKTKDDILRATIEARVASTARMLDDWQAHGQEPADRIRSFIRMWQMNGADIQRYGCPVGTLCAELAKLNHASHEEARELFTLFRRWLREQFALLGCDEKADALAMQLLARSQGMAALANAFHDEAFIAWEVEQMCAWVASLAPGAG